MAQKVKLFAHPEDKNSTCYTLVIKYVAVLTEALHEIGASGVSYFLALPINQKTTTITRTTAKIPTQTPALKISPTTSHPETIVSSKIDKATRLNCVFITETLTSKN